MAVGILSTPPKTGGGLTIAKGEPKTGGGLSLAKTKNTSTQGGSKKSDSKKGDKKKGEKGDKTNGAYRALSKQQRLAIEQREKQDLALGDMAQGRIDQIQDSYDQPFDWESGPQSPVTGDYNAWVDEQMNQYNAAFDRRTADAYKSEQDQFEQDMYNRGIPMGDPLYQKLKTQMLQRQSDERNNAYAQNQAQATQAASNLFNIGSQARGNYLEEQFSKRNMPLNEYNQINAARSGMEVANLQYGQQAELARQEQENQRWMMKNQPRGGGGGGAAPPSWAQKGFSSYQDEVAFNTAQSRAQAEWEWANNPQYKKKGANQWSQVGGQIAGAVAGAAANYYFSS